MSLPVNTVDRLMNKILDYSRSYKDREHDALMNGRGVHLASLRGKIELKPGLKEGARGGSLEKSESEPTKSVLEVNPDQPAQVR